MTSAETLFRLRHYFIYHPAPANLNRRLSVHLVTIRIMLPLIRFYSKICILSLVNRVSDELRRLKLFKFYKSIIVFKMFN